MSSVFEAALNRALMHLVAPKKSESLLLHEWGQSESGMSDAIQRFSNPGDLVADPFLGSGTTAVAALRNGRRFVAGDLEPDCVQTTRTGWASERDLDFLLPLEQTRAAGRSGARRAGCAREPANPQLQRRCARSGAVGSRPAENESQAGTGAERVAAERSRSWGYPR